MARGKFTNFEDSLNEMLGECYDDPLKYVMWAFPWNFESAIQTVRLPEKYRERFPECEFGPDLWACEFLDKLGEQIRLRGFDGVNAVDPIQFATVSGHGIGKSVMCAWLVKFILDTRPFSRGTVTANTADQLQTKTWAEVGKWHRLSLTSHRFDYQAGRGAMILKHRGVPGEWFCKAATCREENSEAFAGQHAANATSFYIFDEASAVPHKIYEVRLGGLTDGEPMTFDFGNGTRNSGDFHDEIENDVNGRFIKVHVDSREVQVSNKAYCERIITDFGEDSDIARVRVRGLFPSRSSLQFLATDKVDEAMSRQMSQRATAVQYQVVLGVDPARHGDDYSVIKPRCGDDARSWPARKFSGLDAVQLAAKVTECVHEFAAIGIKVAAIFVDGMGVGAGCHDILLHRGYPVVEVISAGSANDKKVYWRKGDELWGDMAAAIGRRLVLPGPETEEGKELRTQLTSREFDYTPGNSIKLESKRDMKERGVHSPDEADALALTFAQEMPPIFAGDVGTLPFGQPSFTEHEFDPLERAHG